MPPFARSRRSEVEELEEFRFPSFISSSFFLRFCSSLSFPVWCLCVSSVFLLLSPYIIIKEGCLNIVNLWFGNPPGGLSDTFMGFIESDVIL